MNSIPELEDYTFQEIEEMYIPLAVHFLDPTYLGALEEDEVIDLEYKRLLDLPIYERAEYDDPTCEGVLPARGIGLPGWDLQTSMLMSIALGIYEAIEIDGKEYAISVFGLKTLHKTFNCDPREIVQRIFETACDNLRLAVKYEDKKIMFIVSLEA